MADEKLVDEVVPDTVKPKCPQSFAEFLNFTRAFQRVMCSQKTLTTVVGGGDRGYVLHGCVIWIDVSKNMKAEFTAQDLVDFIKYRLNFKHGSDSEIVIRDVVIWPEDV